MRYSFRFKLESVDLYKQGKWAPCPGWLPSVSPVSKHNGRDSEPCGLWQYQRRTLLAVRCLCGVFSGRR